MTMKAIGVCGMPGSGKGVITKIAEEMGYEIINMGDVIREEAEKRGEDPGKTAIALRREQGKYVVAEKCVKKIMNSGKDKFLIEGIRSPYEVKIFKGYFNKFKVISVFSTRKTRFKRLKKRGSKDDPTKYQKFVERDQRELGFGIGDVIATSDYLIINEGSLWKFKNNVENLLKRMRWDDC